MNADREHFGPVTTEAGEAMRQAALRVLTGRYQHLLGRSKHRLLTTAERDDARGVEDALTVLEGMRPIAPLERGRQIGRSEFLDGDDLEGLTTSERHFLEKGHPFYKGCCAAAATEVAEP